jgi:hypothetical protein
MRGCSFSWILCLVVSVLIAACTQPPKIPELNHREPQAIEKIVLDTKFTPKTFREIYRAINQHGELDAIRSYIEDANDSELEALGELGTTYLYREGDSFRALLTHRIRQRSFTAWSQWLPEAAENSAFRSQSALLFSFLRMNEFPEAASRDIGFLSTDFAETIRYLHEQTKRDPLTYLAEVNPEVSSDDILTDIHLVLSTPGLKDRMIKEGAELEKKSFAFNVLKSLTVARSQTPGPILFEGFGFTFKRLLQESSPPLKEVSRTYRNELDLLLFLAKTLGSKSQGLFQALSDAMAGNLDLPQIFLEKLQKKIDASVAGLIIERLRQPQFDQAFWTEVNSRGPGGIPTPEFNAVYEEVRGALETMLGPSRPADQDGFFQFNLAIGLNAFALTKWVESVVLTKENRSKLGMLFSETPFKFPAAPVTLAEIKVDGKKNEFFDFPLHDQMTEPKLKNLAVGFEAFAKLRLQPISTYSYLFPELKDTTWSVAFSEAVTVASLKQTIAPADAVFHSVLYTAVHPAPSSLFALAVLDSERKTLLEILNQLIVWMEPETFRKLERVLFDKNSMGLGELTPDTIEFIKNVFEGEDKRPIRALIDSLLNSVQMIAELDKPFEVTAPIARSYPSAFEIYYQFLRQTSPDDLPWLTHLLSLFSDGRFAGEETKIGLTGPKSVALFPAVYKTLKNGSPLGNLLYHLSFLPSGEFSTLLGPLQQALGESPGKVSGVELHLSLIEQFFRSDLEGVQVLIEKVRRDGWEVLPTLETLTEGERGWLLKFVKRGDHQKLWDFFKKYGSRDSLLQLVRQLKTLEENGALLNAFGLLTYLKDDRIKELANVLLEWTRTKELKAALAAAEIYLEIPARPRDRLPFHASEYIIDAAIRPPPLRER